MMLFEVFITGQKWITNCLLFEFKVLENAARSNSFWGMCVTKRSWRSICYQNPTKLHSPSLSRIWRLQALQEKVVKWTKMGGLELLVIWRNYPFKGSIYVAEANGRNSIRPVERMFLFLVNCYFFSVFFVEKDTSDIRQVFASASPWQMNCTHA